MRRRRRLLLVRSLVSSTENEIPRRVSEEVPSLSRRNERIRAESERNNNMGNVHINIGNKESKSSSRGNGTNDTNNGSNCLSRVHTKQYVMSRKRQRPASESQTGTPAKNTSFDTQRGSFISDTGSSILLSSAQTDAAVLVSRSPPEFCEQNVNNISTNPIESCVSSSSSLKEKVLPQSPYRADFRCTHCQGSLHKCPLYSRDLEDEGICDNGISTTNRAEPVILCMSPFCKSPHYHVSASELSKLHFKVFLLTSILISAPLLGSSCEESDISSCNQLKPSEATNTGVYIKVEHCLVEYSYLQQPFVKQRLSTNCV